MIQDAHEYIAGGYFLSRYLGGSDCTGTVLRKTTLARDHSARIFFPDSWALSWGSSGGEERTVAATKFGINSQELPNIVDWADKQFEKTFGVWSVIFKLSDARTIARTILKNAVGLDLWGVGLHPQLVETYLAFSTPPPQKPGYAPMGASGTHIAMSRHSAPLASKGTVLGYELLVDDIGCGVFNSPESRHIDEDAMYHALGISPNSNGLINSFEEGIACSRHLEQTEATKSKICGWFPWLIVQYPLEG